MNRTLKLSVLMALALGSSHVLALDLGKVQVKSALGQPLLAEIPLHPANPAELQNLTVQLASSEEFARAGIAGGRTSIPLHFAVANAGTSRPVIRITSNEAVNDPFLDLLLEVNGSTGKSVREFAILLDPPSQALTATPVATTPQQARASVSATPARPAVAASRPTASMSSRVSDGKYGPVKQGDTLSSIAHSATPAGADFNQMLLALKQANPDAFYRDNINALKRGAVLRIPTSAEAEAMTIAAAAEEVRRQNGDWRAGTPSKPTVVADAATRASSDNSASGGNAQSGDRLALVPAKESKASKGGDTSGSGVREDLMRAQESLASMQAQSADLKSRVKDLADINAQNEHLLSLKDSQIAELQAKLAAARKAANLSPAEPVAKPGLAGSTAPADTSLKPASRDLGTAKASTSANAEEAPIATSASSMAPTAPAAAKSSAMAQVPTVVAKQPAPSKPVAKAPIKPTPVVEQPWYMQTWAWAAGAGAIAVLILLALLGRSRKPAAKTSSSLADRFDASSSQAEPGVLGADDIDQDELLDQLAEHPDDIDLHLELVTLYYSRRDVEHFEAAAEAMYAHINNPQQDEWQDVLHMGEDLVPEHPLFDHHVEASGNSNDDGQGDFDIDDYQDEADDSMMGSSQPKKVSEYNFNFDLTKQPVADAGHDVEADDVTLVSPISVHANDPADSEESVSSWKFEETAEADDAHSAEKLVGLDEYNDDPVDTKLDLARAYLDMGDADGARAMLGEALREGSQVQQDTARRLLDGIG